ncbi:SDR family oxidoreductase [Cryomorpha ignava]|uniref:SDR family oxidoreductase n=1 Tax=Cryomorpha ignava TaxID=101383 RepID=A0A7K3WPT6_9FLAO|nr:SDR family oxidoreductase [Cryomorpha ignava]NEN23657.1 SDR family oxidoreductase [Cryomorpha ignava]
MKLQGKNVLITGGSKGIGYGIAESLVKAGCNVVITSRHAEEATKAAEKLSKSGGKAIGLKADVREMAEMERVAKAAESEFGKLDVVIANAGLGHFANIEELTEKQWKEMIDTNLTGLFTTIKSTVKMLKATKGYFISIASLAGTNFFENGSGYNASKFGAVGFTQAVMLDLRGSDVKVTTIMPGSVTSHFAGHTPNADDEWKIQPEDLGEMVIDLLKMNPRTLPSKIEVRPSKPPSAKK